MEPLIDRRVIADLEQSDQSRDVHMESTIFTKRADALRLVAAFGRAAATVPGITLSVLKDELVAGQTMYFFRDRWRSEDPEGKALLTTTVSKLDTILKARFEVFVCGTAGNIREYYRVVESIYERS